MKKIWISLLNTDCYIRNDIKERKHGMIIDELKKQGKALLDARRDNFVRQSLLSDEFLNFMQQNKKPFDLLMSYYECAIMEIETKFRVLNHELSLEYDNNPIESIKTRVKSYDSILKKIRRKNIPLNLQAIEENLKDIAGVRVICSFPDDIYKLAESFLKQDDITLIEQTGLIENGWEQEFADDSSPYTSTIVFLVRKGNPKQIRDWDDLVNKKVEIITPDPKSSGGACWNFLAALSYIKEQTDDEKEQKAFLQKLYSQVSVMDSGARGSTTTFVENQKGDVLIAWENEAITTMKSYPDEYEMITPSVSILAQPSVAVVDDNADANGTQEVSREYLNYLYTDDAQRLAAEYGYRPSNESILKEFSDRFDLNVKLYTIKDYGGWNEAYKNYFDDGAMFDEIYGNE